MTAPRATPPDSGPPRTLPITAGVEAISLIALLVNLATVHLPSVAAALGPAHGTAYLITIVLTWTGTYPTRARALALIPGVGGLLVLRVPRTTTQDE